MAEEYTVRNVVTDGLTTGSGGRQQKWLQDWAQANASLETVEVPKVPAGGKTSAVIDPIRCSDEDPRLKVLWGAVTEKPEHWSQAHQKNGNNHSVVLRIDFGRASFLMTGDLESEGIAALLEKQNPKALDADVWQVSHHGSYNGLNQDFLDAITPSIALLGTSPPSRQQQWTRRQRCFDREEIERAAFATGWDGSVVVTANNQGRYWVETER